MTTPPTLPEQIADRVQRLLLRHEELQRTNALLNEQVSALTQERDALKTRLLAARARVDALIDRLPTVEKTPAEEPVSQRATAHVAKQKGTS